ncbi:MAG: hypothetical protein ACP5UH_02255 [Candidatus Micrarchaeia archaeon]
MAVAFIYLVAALAMFFPLTEGITKTAPGNGAFAYTDLWSFWWIDHALFNDINPFVTYMLFYPVGVNLTAQQLSILTPVVFGPFGALGTAFAYNVALFTGFMLSGFCMFLLAKYITHGLYGPFVAGLIFEFGALHVAGAYTSMPLMFVAFIPLFVYFMIKAFSEPVYKGNAFMMGVSLVLASLMGNVYQAVLLEVLFICAFIAYLAHGRLHKSVQAKRYTMMLVSFAVAAVIAGIAYMPLFGTTPSIQEEQAMSASVESFFIPSYYNGLAHSAVMHLPVYSQLAEYRSTYIGYATLLLAAAGGYATRKRISTKLLALLAFFSGWLALGPVITLAGSGKGIGGLYALYALLPYFNVLHEPVYFDLLATLAIAVLAAYGIDMLAQRMHKQGSTILVIAIISLAVLAENNGMPLGASTQAAFYTRITVPSIYSIIGSSSGNFSVLVLPGISTPSNDTSALYASEADFYSSIAHKPIVGGYSESENFTDIESVYNVPLAMQATNLAYFNEFSYASPVVQNYTNQTLLTLYNYGTAVIVVNKNAYNESDFLGLANYMVRLFGAPVHNGANDIAFETAHAINASIYRSFVAYPALNEWIPVSIYVNATPVQLWEPGMQSSSGSFYGAITVYAPYADTTGIANGTYAAQSTPTRIGFDAYSSGRGSIEIGELSNNLNRTIVLGSFNTTATLQHYVLNATLWSGPYGNILFFITQPAERAYVYNITFSR